ncbi:unnamed protein product [Haemonchus placei]|uniref:tRNA-synt_2 domain-containing protein n=1 Tax=Haemonchus placei TaxID=6290 RepID=A0A0N4WF44_HAEPC|nr:unnamed protein product [Haemonchus placei]
MLNLMRMMGSVRRKTTINGYVRDVRVGRHRDKLELIRDSLRPFEQTVNEVPTTNAVEQAASATGESTTNSPTVEQQRAMVDSLIAQGYEQVEFIQFQKPLELIFGGSFRRQEGFPVIGCGPEK